MTDREGPGCPQSVTASEGVKRSDVGYKRPPVEHRFTKDRQPGLRQKKEELREVPMTETLRELLSEERPVLLNEKVRYVTVAELVMRRAWLEAEKGSATLRREMLRLSLSFEANAPDLAPLVVTDVSAPASATEFRQMPVDGSQS